ncbi:MAG: hypothetical protein E7381_01585 [Clostridiales bacterium]|nr:hypothetical protein [Clostridiales bacterium]
MKEIYIIYSPLWLAICIVVAGWMIYYSQKYRIGDASTMNKYKLSPTHILIKLKLFKYDNRFNYFLLIPYLVSWGLFLLIFVLYILYWLGVAQLKIFLGNKFFILSLMGLLLLYMLYMGGMQQHILNSNRIEKPNFVVENKKKEDENKKYGDDEQE